MNIISMQQFLERTAMKGRLVNKDTGEIQFPPGNRTDWNGRALHEKDLFEYLRQVTDVRNWKPGECLAAFPADVGEDHIEHLQTMMKEVWTERPNKMIFEDNPVNVDAEAKERLREVYKDRRNLCIYDSQMQSSLVVHFMCYHKERARLLTHFYTFLFFEDWKHDLWSKRFVRDHLRYIDELQCAAARVITAIRQRSMQNDPDANGQYHSFHIRRGDFQYKQTRLSGSAIYDNTKDILIAGRTVYIATDERDKSFFAPLADHYDICFLDDFHHLFPDLNTNYYGMLDQLIASKGDIFVGAFFSTFTGYINRMRGYQSVKHKEEGYDVGKLQSYFYAPLDRKMEMTKYRAIDGLFAREFPISWRDLNNDVEE